MGLAAFLHWGEEAVVRLRGEWAFAVVDRATGRLYLARWNAAPLVRRWIASRPGRRTPVG